MLTGMAAFELLRLHKEETEKYNRILLNAKRRLQVQVLERKAERVSREQMRDACLKLGRASIKLQGLFKGLRVHVSDHYDFDESGLVVIPHDFRMGTFY